MLLQPIHSAPPRSFTIGFVLGDPTGISLMQNFDPLSAVQVAFASDKRQFLAQIDYLIKRTPVTQIGAGRSFFYYGIGLRLEIGDRETHWFGPYRSNKGGSIGMRMPIGWQHYFERLPFDLFAEAAPHVAVAPETHIDLSPAIGLRYNF